ncbi:translation initiation factor eIF-1A [Candidatus Woesearchaeota archaeon]|nr:translation initiation factor eIF-1A [Candidatus Woesearchaeota archaeon]
MFTPRQGQRQGPGGQRPGGFRPSYGSRPGGGSSRPPFSSSNRPPFSANKKPSAPQQRRKVHPGKNEKDVLRDRGFGTAAQQAENEELQRVKLPRGNETLGVLEQRMGGNRVRVRCLDGKTRICRIPGRLKRKLWVREGDIVLVEPWELSGDEKGDVIFKYRPTQVDFLKRKGLLKTLDEFTAF